MKNETTETNDRIEPVRRKCDCILRLFYCWESCDRINIPETSNPPRS